MSDPTHVKNQLCKKHLKGLLHFKQNAISVIIFYLRSIATIVANHCLYCRPMIVLILEITKVELIIFPYKHVLHLRFYKYGITRCVAGNEMEGAIYTAKHVSVSFLLFLISLGIFGWIITIMKTCYIWFYTPFTHFDIKKSACMAKFQQSPYSIEIGFRFYILWINEFK